MTGLAVTLFGVERLFGNDIRAVIEMAAVADRLGVDQVVLPDHVVMGGRTDQYPFGRFPAAPDDAWSEPLTVLAAIAARTEGVRLGTGALVAPLRPAALLAQTVATVDALSRGRLDLGVGTGWQADEFAALGVPFEERGWRLDDTVRACHALWDGAPASFASRTVRFDEVWCRPAPAQPRLPIWFAGPPTRRTGRRIARMGHGWLPIAGTSPEDVRRGIGVVHAEMAAAGRDPLDLGVRVTAPVVAAPDGIVDLDATLNGARTLVAAGATLVSFPLVGLVRSAGDVEDVLHWLVAEGRRW